MVSKPKLFQCHLPHNFGSSCGMPYLFSMWSFSYSWVTCTCLSWPAYTNFGHILVLCSKVLELVLIHFRVGLHKPLVVSLSILSVIFLMKDNPKQWSGRFVGIIGWSPSVCKSNWLHVRHPPVFLYWLGVYSVNSSKKIDNFPAVLNINWLFLKLNWFIL